MVVILDSFLEKLEVIYIFGNMSWLINLTMDEAQLRYVSRQSQI